MNFDNSFFEDEVREGFYVPGMIKRAWAAELEVLSEVDRICRKYNIEYYADWGTLLATVRHNGFIPWDDDLDIVMKRQDYERFLSVCKDEFPEGYEAYNYKNNDDYWLYICRVVGRKRICFEKQHLDRFHQFPYIAGVDIFVLDYVSKDEKAEEGRDALARYSIVTSDQIAEGRLSGDEAIEALKIIDGGAGTDFVAEYKGLQKLSAGTSDFKQAMDGLRRGIYSMAEELFGRFSAEESDDLTQLFPFGMQNKAFRFPKKMYEKSVRLSYEGTTMPVPYQYIEVLKKRYGDFMRLVKNAGAHGYPFFETQHNEFVKLLDFELPHFVPKMEMIGRKETHDSSFSAYRNKLKEAMELLTEAVSLEIPDCNDVQELAIFIGTMLEKYDKTAAETVSSLEVICEKAYELYQTINTPGSLISELKELVDNIVADITDNILPRKKIIFLVYKPESFYLYEPYINSYGEDTDVFVVPVPYSYKNYDSTTHDRKIVTKGYPDGIVLEDPDEFDIEFLGPDTIYTQQPYDEWNATTLVDNRFFSAVLKEQCRELIYIPWFTVDEFSSTDYRQCHNMKDYVKMPGVVYSDKVILQSENMCELYIKMLLEWLPDIPEEIWKAKICWHSQNLSAVLTDDDKKQHRKTLIYHVELSSFMSYDNCLDKIRKNLEIFYSNKDKLNVIWLQDADFEDKLTSLRPDLLEEYKVLRNNCGDSIVCSEISFEIDSIDEQSLINSNDAYYGDPCRIAMLFNINKKPVMIASYEV